MSNNSLNNKNDPASGILRKVIRYKKQGCSIADILSHLSRKHDLRGILELLLGDQYEIRTVISERLIVIDENNNETDGIDMLQRLIRDIAQQN